MISNKLQQKIEEQKQQAKEDRLQREANARLRAQMRFAADQAMIEARRQRNRGILAAAVIIGTSIIMANNYQPHGAQPGAIIGQKEIPTGKAARPASAIAHRQGISGGNNNASGPRS